MQKNGGPPSLLAANFRLSGDLENKGDLQIDGFIEGNVISDSLTIGETGQVKGNVVAKDLCIMGTVTGTIHAGSLVVNGKAQIDGDIYYESIQIQEGASLNVSLAKKSFEGDIKQLPPFKETIESEKAIIDTSDDKKLVPKRGELKAV